ncbi:polysaccharide deacetylase family protein [Curvibacter sp. APW13]|uniref:polysaccharide deacetylase family protein n=1 Tax=Curvibacter sp. APW13 TaxID=3077236 RepID=UPI0028E09974|nr:polysaccharide deacetylase family protein [Curvibacter sp. APW13]MDT8990065.1 polysaccharide deacetylase family protein [Curvibacter sp. APW13]
MTATLVLDAMERSPRRSDNRQKKPFYKRFGTYIHLFIVVGIAAPTMIYMEVMKNLGWRMPAIGANGALVFSSSGSNNVTLYASTTSRGYFNGIGANYDLLLTPWRDYFGNRKTKFREISDAAQIRKVEDGILVLPSAVALSAEERTEILAFRARGGAVLASWATGTRSAKGEWEGWQFIENFGAKVLGEVPAESEANHLILNAESPISHSVLAGQRVFMSKTSESLLRLRGDNSGGRFTNWARIIEENRRGDAGVVFQETTPETGRTVVFGFAESAWANHPLAIYPFLDDAIRWLQREPTAIRAAWPHGKQAANVIEMDTEDKFNNALNFESMMQAVDYPTSFYVLTSVAKQFPDTVTRLAREAEIGFHGDIHVGFKDQPVAQQEQRMQTMRRELSGVMPDISKVSGFRAPTEGYDATTEKLLFAMGLRHHVADPNRSEGRWPLFAKVEGSTPDNDLVVLPRTQRDDINLYWEKLGVEQTTQALIDDAELALENAGLGLLSVHTQNFDTSSVLYKALPAYLVHLKQKRNVMWLASAGKVADWWRDRERFLVRSSFTGKRLDVDVTVIGKTPVNGGTILIMLPQKDTLPTVQNTKTSGLKPTVSRIDSYRAAMVFPSLPPGNYSYQVTFAQ